MKMSVRNRLRQALTLATLLPTLAAAPATAPTTQPDTRPKSPADELKTIVLPAGYHLELVASDPDLISPVLCTWDGNGRMYVAEMRTYMLDINGSNSHTPASRVSRWESTKHDDVYDKHTIFADKLMLPRMVLPLDERILIRVTDTKDMSTYRDTNNDGVADQITNIYKGGDQEGNLEHQPSGILWDIDNWMYLTHQPERFRFTRGKIEKETYRVDTGQWGLGMMDNGQLIYATAGAENPAHNFQVMPQYGNISLPAEVKPDFYDVNPIEYLSDVQGGPPRLRPQGGLNRFTGCAGPSIFRGDALPHDLYGDYILPEPVGRLIRRAKITDTNGELVVSNPSLGKEFIASTDPNFRPVWSATGPDGCLYICDMYHGIIQEANWTKEGSYLRPQIQKYGLDKNINHGRIWRLVHDGYTKRAQPHMLDETPAQLVTHLSDPNGWWRDTAQKLIILRGDKSVVPALRAMAMDDSNPLARLHALWTLEGLDSADNDLILAKLKDTDPMLRAAAVRVSEPLLRQRVSPILRAVRNAAFDPDPDVAKQVICSMFYVKDPSAEFVVNRAISTARTEAKNKVLTEVVSDIHTELNNQRLDAERKKQLSLGDPKFAATFDLGHTYFQQMCISCHGANGLGANTPDGKSKLAPPLKGSERAQSQPDLVARILLNGLTGVNNGKTYPEQMPNFRWADDARLSTVLTYVRNEWGNSAPAIQLADVAKQRPAAVTRNKPFLPDDLPKPIVESRPHQIILTTGLADISGNGANLLGDIITYGMYRNATVSWKPSIPEAGVYEIKLRCQSFGPTSFTIKIGEKSLPGIISSAGTGDLDVGATHLAGNPTLEFHPASPNQTWSPMNLQAIVLERLE
ncbi:MAG TPA: c-type cytochrome [Tepidisphaeraceae bacterium]|jgi:mono/diheme cytochrome c family protein|nr:c-type cytochrome [Tepidisphaeraceae bacterium]